jgi:predicted metal-binding protein
VTRAKDASLTNGILDPADTLFTSASASEETHSVTVVVCSSCRRQSDPEGLPRPGSFLAKNTARAAESTNVRVRQVACLGNCKRGLSAAILREGCWSYVFGDLDPDSGPDLVAGAELFARSEDGFMPFRERPESLKRGLIARIPTYDSLKEIP